MALLAALPLGLPVSQHDMGDALAQAQDALEIASLASAGAVGDVLWQAERRTQEAAHPRGGPTASRDKEGCASRGSFTIQGPSHPDCVPGAGTIGASDARRLVVWPANVHRIGQATPAFECQVELLADAMRADGLEMRSQRAMGAYRRPAPHWLAGQVLLGELLLNRHGWTVSQTGQFTVAVGGHPGVQRLKEGPLSALGSRFGPSACPYDTVGGKLDNSE